MLRIQEINKLLGVDDSWKAPEVLMKALMERDQREELFKKFLEKEHDLSFDWFRNYFESEAAERKNKKQDFTPDSVTKLLTKIIGDGKTTIDSAAGTGGITISKWWNDCTKALPWDYLPSNYLYWTEELSDRAIPFLLFNLAIRGMNAVVVHIDLLSREGCKGVYFVQNTADNFLGFSSINVIPQTQEVNQFFNVNSWAPDATEARIEDKVWPEYLTRRGAIYSDE